jgi:hypothetical protein
MGPQVTVLGAIAVDRHAAWFAVKGGIGRLSLRDWSRSVISLPDADGFPSSLAIGKDGRIWFTEAQSDIRCLSECGAVAVIAP